MTTTKREACAARMHKVQQSIAAAVSCPHCPQITPERGAELLQQHAAPSGALPASAGSAAARRCAAELVDDPAWVRQTMAWLEHYRREHGHGPTWRALYTELPNWPHDTPMTIRRTAHMLLCRHGLIDGNKTPFGLRPRDGWERQLPQVPTTRPAT